MLFTMYVVHYANSMEQVLYIAAPSSAVDMLMMLPWALSILLLQVVRGVAIATFVKALIISLMSCCSNWLPWSSHPYSAACHAGNRAA